MSKLISYLASVTGLSALDVRSIINRAPISYKRYTIPKRSGGKRLISQPAREVKALQRALARRLNQLPIHDAATAYRIGQSIRVNAQRHAGNGPIMKFDFSDFFPSIRSDDWAAYCAKHEIFSEWEDIGLSSKLFFQRLPGSSILRLAIGAPSSPWLSNVLMHEFDQKLTSEVERDHVTYTRYADDLTFSAPRTGHLTIVERTLRKVVREITSPKLVINEAKTVLATPKYRRVVTGLVLANDGRVTIGRDRKRLIRAWLHHAFKGKNSADENARLAGLLAFAGDVEPKFLDSAKARYGVDLLARLSGSELATRG